MKRILFLILSIMLIASSVFAGQTINGGRSANDDLTLNGTTSATKDTSYVIVQPIGGKVLVGTSTASSGATVEINGSVSGTSVITDTISEKTSAAGVTIDSVLLKDGGVSPLKAKGPAIIETFAGTVSTSGSSTTITFSSAADAILAGYNATNPTLGTTIITGAIKQASVTRYVVSWTNSTACVVDSACTLAAATELTSVQLPITTFVNSAGVVQGWMNAAGVAYFVGNVGIGTIAPLSKLDVNGGVAVGTYAGVNAAPANGLIVSGQVALGVATPVPNTRLTVDSLADQPLTMRLRNGDAPRYRNDWSISSGGLTVNAYDDTGLVALPYSFNGSQVNIYASNPGGNFSYTFGAINSRYAVLDGLRLSGSDTTNSIYQANPIGITSGANITINPTSNLIINGNVGIGTASPSEKLDVVGNIKFAGTTGGFVRKVAEATSGALSGATGSIAVNVPSGARILGIQLRVDTLVTSDIGTSWSAIYVNTPTTAICALQALAANTKFNAVHPAYEITTGTVTITLAPNAGTFTAGVIRAIVYYEAIDAMASL